MKRDIIKQAEKGEQIKNNRRDITITELDLLHKKAVTGPEGLFEALTLAFHFGFYQGYTQRKAEEKK